MQRWTWHILTNNGPTVQETMPYILGGERMKLKGQTHVDIKAMGSRPPATREDVGAETFFFLGSKESNKKNTKKKTRDPQEKQHKFRLL